MRAILLLVGALGASAATSSCSIELSLEERPCPCAPGYSCRLADQVCVESPPVEPPVEPGDTEFRCTREAPECYQGEKTILDSFESAAQVAELLVGRWLVCEGTEAAESDPTLMGIEFASDGTFYYLVRNQEDECVRDQGFERQGTWTIEDISEQNPPGTYQASLHWAGGGTGGLVPSFSATPRKMSDGGWDYWGELIADPQ